MIIENRDLSIKYPRAIKDDKTRIVLDWLLEFRFSSTNLLSSRLGQTNINTNRFFNSLIDDKVIQSFKNVHTKNHRYVMLASAGVSYLEAFGRNVDKAITRVSNLGKYSQILHDLSVQETVLSRLDSFEEVIWDRHINIEMMNDRPDAILKANKDGSYFWSAIEFERWRKSKMRIYISFLNHVKNIQDNNYAGVYYLFQNESDCRYYKKLFSIEDWPIYIRKPNSTKIKLASKSFFPDSVTDLRRRFIFKYEPVSF